MSAATAAGARPGLRSVDRGLIGLAFILTLSSLAPVQKYLGTAGVVGYVLWVSGVVLWGLRPIARWLTARVSERQALWLAAATLVGLGLLFAVVYPIADAGVVGGGSDREDSLTVATQALLQGRYPYYAPTYLNQLPPVLPGAIFWAVPFVLLGDSAYQNLFWLAAFLIVARWLFQDGRLALLALWVIFALAPAAWLELVTGGELISNSVYVLTFSLLLTRPIAEGAPLRWSGLAYAALLGVALSSRANFLLLLPLVFSALVQNVGWKGAVLYFAVVCLAFVAITLPFYLYDPAGFAPAVLQNKFARFQSFWQYADVAALGSTAFVAVALALRRLAGRGFALLMGCAIVEGMLIVAGHLLTSLQTGSLNLSFGVEGWGLFCLFFGVLAAWPAVARPGPALPPQPA